jgi:hypothetical protein
MQKEMQRQYVDTNLVQLVERLRKDSYDEVVGLCDNATKQIGRLENTGLQHATTQYTSTCGELIAEIRMYMAERKEKFIPYLQSLSEKAETNHDCSSCSGGCKINHDLQLIELKASHSGMRSILNRLQVVALPLYSDTALPDAYRVLRNQMALIENGLTELFFLEENYLLPKVVDAQKRINAGHKY